ncbi:MAG: 4-hydroxy-tetrahydrodipicolinate reductase [Treponema sp.]|jgi:4-hydroxy-tetrahydrodipicolinate reductase|nr:4-hydroxy-tetrahydrodipicolinate reductase [Treponema sp.]
MNIAIIGYGKMGKLLEERAIEKGHNVIAAIDPHIAQEKTVRRTILYKSINALADLRNLDLAIEVTHPDIAPGNLLFLAKEKIATVTGTTGWYSRLPEISTAFEKTETSLFWAPNFSLGMNLFYRLAEYAAEIFDPFGEYDAGGFESHHNKKADSPSGTAKTIAEKVLSKMTRKKKVVYEMLDRPPAPDELHFASLRVGSVQGLHSVIFDSSSDTIEITHTLRSREGLAAGALKAAEWLFAKKDSGVFTMDDMLADILQHNRGQI